MKKLLSTIVVLAAIVVLFYFANDVSNNRLSAYLKNKFEDVYISLENGGDIISGLLGDIKNPATQGPTLPSVSVPDIPEGSDFQVHFIDVGQADCILIACDGEYMLIDGGNDADGSDVVAYLRQREVEELALVVGTHSHEDHIGGLDHVLNAFDADEVWFPEYRANSVNEKMFLEAAAKQGTKVYQPDPGTTYTLGSAVCQVLGPLSLDPEEPNNHSIVIKVIYGETSFLFTGDMEFAAETEILDAGYDIKCDVLKVAHHGSNSSTKYRWVRAADPTYAVISVGAGNEYGHPTDACLSILEDAEIEVYRTDLLGHIVCISDGKTVSFITGGDAS